MRTILLLLLLAIGISSHAQIRNPVKWSFETKKAGTNEYDLIFTATMEKGWIIYSQYTAPEDGPVPTTFEFDPGSHYSRIGKVEEKGKKKEGMDPLFGVIVIKFVSGQAIFIQRVKVSNPNLPVKGYLNFMTCDDEQCLPPTDVDFEFKFPADAGSSAVNPTVPPASNPDSKSAEPTPPTAVSENAPEATESLPATSSSSELDSALFAGVFCQAAKVEGNMIDQSIPTIRDTYQAPLGNCGEEDVARNQSWIWTFVMGFLGGLVALLTPCVFPMIPLTVSFFTKSSKDRSTGIRNAITYGLSIIFIYVAIGLLITGVFGATALNELSTNWIANTLFFVIFVAFAFSFFGYYEITLPSSWSNQTDRLADKGGIIGTFFMATTLALVSFSCTGPIIGSAIVEAAKSTMGPFLVMLGFSTALALPFGLFAAFPGWLQSLPKSGGWMNSVKVVLGFLELALALKFLSVADMTMHWGILPYELFMALWVLIFAATTAYLFGLFRFPHDSPMRKLSPVRGMFGLLFLGLTIYLATGFFVSQKTKSYNSLKLMSGLAPPAHYNLLLPEEMANAEIKKKYPSFTKGANNLDCFKDYCEGLAYAKEVGKPVLLDFTGFGCVNCRKTEEHIWVKDKVWQRIQNDFVLVSLYVDDRTPLDQVLISKKQQNRLRNVGLKWSDFQIVNFEQNTQPLYVMLTPDEKVLAAPRGYKEDANSYAEFLECGLTTFGEYNNQKLGSND